MEQELINSLLTNGGGTATVIIFLILAKKFWRSLSQEMVATTEDGAKTGLINSLAEDIERIKKELIEVKTQQKEDMAELKAEHRKNMLYLKRENDKEKEALGLRLSELAKELSVVKDKYSTVKTQALSLYHKLSDPSTPTNPFIEEIRVKLLELCLRDDNFPQGGGG